MPFKSFIALVFVLILGEGDVFSQSDTIINGKKYFLVTKHGHALCDTNIYRKKLFYKIYYDNGQLKNEGLIRYPKPTFPHMIIGKRLGKWIEYYQNGTKKSEKTYRKGKWNGEAKYWYDNGQMEKEGSWTFKERTQGYTFRLTNYWSTTGEHKVKNGSGDSEQHHEDGRKWVGHWKDGKEHGTWTCSYPDGSKTESEYVEGKKDGIEKWWDKDGNLTRERLYKNGKEVTQ